MAILTYRRQCYIKFESLHKRLYVFNELQNVSVPECLPTLNVIEHANQKSDNIYVCIDLS